MIAPRPTLYRDAALADPTGPSLRKEVSLLVDAGHVVWIRPSTDEGDLPPDVHVIDAGGSTIVPGMVDAHSHVTLPGGSHWIDRGADPPDELLDVAEHNGDLLGRAGVRWARDVGSPLAVDPRDGRRRALALRVRDRCRSRFDRTRIRARLGRGRDDGPSGDVPREHLGDLPLLGLLRADDDVAPVRQRRGEGADRASAGAGDRERAPRLSGGRADRNRHGVRRRGPASVPTGAGGGGGGRNGPDTL